MQQCRLDPPACARALRHYHEKRMLLPQGRFEEEQRPPVQRLRVVIATPGSPVQVKNHRIRLLGIMVFRKEKTVTQRFLRRICIDACQKIMAIRRAQRGEAGKEKKEAHYLCDDY